MSTPPPPTKPVALVIGASRGIGRQIAIDLAKNNYTVIVAAKTTSSPTPDPNPNPNPNSPSSTIHTVTQEIISQGGTAYALRVDVRSPTQIASLVTSTLALTNNRLDVVVYNSGAIWWGSIRDTPLKRFQLMQQVNPEGLYATVMAVLPVFEAQGNCGRVVVVSPPVYSRFWRGKGAYAMGKVAMSVLTRGLAMDFMRQGKKDMAVTSLWPATAIESAATEMNPGSSSKEDLRKPTIFSDAVLGILNTPAHIVNGMLALDEDFLRQYCGVEDFSKYSVVPGATPRRIMPKEFPVLEVAEQDDEGVRMDSTKGRAKL
ncbi:hypothetical protein ASPCADRAFT_130733 [Aspergillus carbonarius ITEM 5010]|uniref:Short chain dehydrogenase family protein n=1 Tax=Aspergillus carbonarius (strain ITEM 5010) TaxID=602072 RepID=A0A1R3RL79_ASPC5|nr:hypothetical protein ASPCADRAFT_130733 [Aspergillus carbonarius ITEM 5010]